jgi:hypothetical protein
MDISISIDTLQSHFAKPVRAAMKKKKKNGGERENDDTQPAEQKDQDGKITAHGVDGKKKVALISILDSRRFRNLSIIRSRLRKFDDAELCHMVKTCSYAQMHLDDLSALRLLCPTDEDRAAFKDFNLPVGHRFKDMDAMIWKFLHIPHFEDWVAIMIFLAEFEESKDEMKKELRLLHEVVGGCKSAQPLAQVMALFLKVAQLTNNAKTMRGITISSLLHYKEVKVSDTKTTALPYHNLFEYMAYVACGQFPPVNKEATTSLLLHVPLEDAAAISFSSLMQTVESLERSMGRSERHLAQWQASGAPEERQVRQFHEAASAVIRRITSEATAIFGAYHKLLEEVQSCYEYFGEPVDLASGLNREKPWIWEEIAEFVKDWRQACSSMLKVAKQKAGDNEKPTHSTHSHEFTTPAKVAVTGSLMSKTWSTTLTLAKQRASYKENADNSPSSPWISDESI